MNTQVSASADIVSASVNCSKPPMPPNVAAALLKALGTDDDFRALFKSDPRKALNEVGYHLSPSVAMPLCMLVAELASKEDIQNAYSVLHAHLSGTARASMLVPHMFGAAPIIEMVRAA
ncbi:NHLP-related RiPP peptide [Stenotrophomonas sp. PS02289]|uniref:NHLP-related RiPP peptide n=1 Tax=Stenotrophomonas sp. PS02289 TaxID=2991422 RepID=UPI00249AB1C8|nr:NHLP-related RiPP peptide [Stenotrophomonas sp. PS02289]